MQIQQAHLRARLECASADAPIKVVITNDSVSDHGVRLMHGKKHVDLSRASSGLPLIISHEGRDLPIGRVEHLTVSDKDMRGQLRFSARATDIEADMRAGIITDVSIGAAYDLAFADVGDDGITTISKWTPREVSVVSMGAIPGAGVIAAASPRVVKMDDRLEQIKALYAPFQGAKYAAMRLEAIDKGMSVEQAREALLAHCATLATDPPAPARKVEAIADERDKYAQAGEIALRYRASAYSDTEAGRAERKADAQALAGNELAGLSLVELAREGLRRAGISTVGMNSRRVADLALRGTHETRRYTAAGGHTSSDFTSLISTTANKRLAAGYDEAEESWRAWTSIVNLNNFQQHQFPNLSSFGDLVQRREGGAYEHGSFSDKHELMTLKEYGKRFSLDRQTIINDDLNAFTRIPQLMGRAAARNIGDLVYAVLTTGTTATMNEDAVALFDAATHANYVTAGAAPSVTTLNAALVSMATQTDPGGATLGLRPRHIIVPIALETTTRVLLASANDPAITPETPNPFRGAFNLVSDYRLDAANSNGWYMAAAAGQAVETVAVGFLDGQQTPTLEEEETHERPGIIYTVMHDATAAALDWRGLYYNDGVT